MDDTVDPLLMLDSQIAKRAVDSTEGDWKAKLFSAWEEVDKQSLNPHRWGPAWDDYRFRAGLGGLLLFLKVGTEEYKHILFEIKQIRKLDTLIVSSRQGLGLTLADVLQGEEEEAKKYPALGLIGWFREWKEHKTLTDKPEYRRAYGMMKELTDHCKKHQISIHVTIGSEAEGDTIGNYSRQQRLKIHQAIGQLSQAIGNPAVQAKGYSTIESSTVLAAVEWIEQKKHDELDDRNDIRE